MLPHALNHHLAYEVGQVLIVRPEEAAAIDIGSGEDPLALVLASPIVVWRRRRVWQDQGALYAAPGERMS